MRRKLYGFAAVAVAGALALAGCSAGGSNGQSGGGDAVQGEGTNPQERGNLEQGGELRMSISAMPDSWNTLSLAGNNVDTNRIASFAAPQNWLYNADGSFVDNPTFVTSHEVKTGDDASNGKQEVILHLNDKAVWGDGSPITWEDYSATWHACGLVDENGNTVESSDFDCASNDGFSHWESVGQGDTEYDVVIAFRDVFPDWSAALSSVYPRAGIADAKTFNEGWEKPNNDWFTGPYKFANVDEAQQVITLEPNENWWADEALLDTVSFRVLDPAAAATAYAAGELDVLEGIIDAQQYLQAEGRADGEIRRAGGLTWRHFTFNGDSGVLADKELRAVLARGVDRVAITESDLAGIPDLDPQALVLGNHFFMPDQEGYENNGKDWDFDFEGVQKDLDELGWTLDDGADVRTNEAGEKLTFEYVMMPDISTSKNEGELLQAQMKEIGVEVTIKNVSSAEFFEEYVFPGKFGVTSFAWQGTPYPMANITQLYGCTFGRDGGSNFTNVCVDEIQTLAEEIAVDPDHSNRIKKTNDVDKLIWENGMILPLYQRMEMTAVPANLANYGAFGMSSVPFQNIGYMK